MPGGGLVDIDVAPLLVNDLTSFQQVVKSLGVLFLCHGPGYGIHTAGLFSSFHGYFSLDHHTDQDGSSGCQLLYSIRMNFV